jgi:hypothetical protein
MTLLFALNSITQSSLASDSAKPGKRMPGRILYFPRLDLDVIKIKQQITVRQFDPRSGASTDKSLSDVSSLIISSNHDPRRKPILCFKHSLKEHHTHCDRQASSF